MLRKLAKKLFSKAPLTFFKTKQNVLIIQMYPKQQVMSVSYKGQVKTAQFHDDSIKQMLKGGKHFEEDTFNVFGAAVRLIAQIINYKEPNAKEEN